MAPFPEDYELISLFSQEPELLDADTPWFYNTLKFTGQRAHATYLVRISPAYGELEIQITHPDQAMVHLSLTGGKDWTLWYYRALSDAFQARWSTPLRRERERVMHDLETLITQV